MTTLRDTASAAASCSAGQGTAGERADILETLRTHRYFLRHTVEGLSDEQARLSPTASELTLGGLIKHVAATEAGWADFIERGTEAMPSIEGELRARSVSRSGRNEFRLLPDETLADVLAAYEQVAARTDALVESLPTWTRRTRCRRRRGSRRARRARRGGCSCTSWPRPPSTPGHADIIRETIDGQKTMG